MAKPYLTFETSETNINIVNNTSDITVTLVWNDPDVKTWNANGFCSLTIDGQTSTWKKNVTKARRTVLGSITKTINHNSDGTRTISISAYADISQYWGRTYASTTRTLTTIKRATELPALGEWTLGKTVTVNFRPHSANFTHLAYYKLNGQLYEFSGGSAGSTAMTWIPPLELANSFPDSNVVTGGEFILETYSGGKFIGSHRTKHNIKIGPNCGLKIDSVEIFENVKEIDTFFNLNSDTTIPPAFIERKSRIGVITNVNFTNAYGATVKNCTVTLGNAKVYGTSTEFKEGQVVIPYEIPKTKEIPEKRMIMTVEVEDSRGYKCATSKALTIIPYRAPKMEDIKIRKFRADAMALELDYRVSPIRNLNPKKLIVKFKKVTDADYLPENVRDANLSTGVYEGMVGIMANPVDPEISYVFTAELTDFFGIDVAEKVSGEVCISRLAGGKGVSLFRPAEKEGFWVDGVDYTVKELEARNLMVLLGDANPTPPYSLSEILLRLASHVYNTRPK